jgi:hypothetical protein
MQYKRNRTIVIDNLFVLALIISKLTRSGTGHCNAWDSFVICSSRKLGLHFSVLAIGWQHMGLHYYKPSTPQVQVH